MPEPSFDTISNARDLLRIEMIERLVSSIAYRLTNPDDISPIVLRVSRNGLGAQDAIKQIGTLLNRQATLIDVTEAQEGLEREDTRAFVERIRHGYKLLVLTGWEKNLEKATDCLHGIMDARRPGSVVIVVAIGDEESDPDQFIGQALGAEIWREISYIEVDAPAVLDDEAIARLAKMSD